MHGLIFNELRKYANTRFGEGTWATLLGRADAEGRIYLASQTYPDQELVALVTAASSATGRGAADLLEDFGEFIVPDLLSSFRSLIRAEWRTLDVLENVEDTIHRVVRLQVRDAAPPQLHTARMAPHHVRIKYASSRRLCFVAKGIIKGLARHYGEPIAIAEPECMHRGRPACLLDVTQTTA